MVVFSHSEAVMRRFVPRTPLKRARALLIEMAGRDSDVCPFLPFRRRFSVARIVGRIDVVDLKRADAVDLDNSRASGPAIMLHALFCGEKTAGLHDFTF